MSLINEALKKAQKQQHDAAAKGSGSTAPPENPPNPPKPPRNAPSGVSSEPDPDPIFAARRKRKGGGRGRWGLVAVFVIVIGGVGFGLTSNEPPVAEAVESPPAQGVPPTDVAGPESRPAAGLAAEKPKEMAAVLASSEQSGGISLLPALVVTPVPATTVEEQPTRLVEEPVAVTHPVSKADEEPMVPTPVSQPFVQTKLQVTQAVPATLIPSSTLAVADQVRSGSTVARPRSIAPVATAAKVVIETVEEPSVSNVSQKSQANNAVLSYLERARVTGIRVSATDPKVLMNNRVYRLNEIVDRDLQLRIVTIAPRELQFEDPSGHVYRKTF